MLPENIHKTIPFSRLFRLVLGMAVFLQIILVAYNHFSGYHQLYGFQEYILRVLRGVAYSIVAGFAIAYPDLYLVQSLNARLPWKNNIVKRLSIQAPATLLIAALVSVAITLAAHWIGNYRQEIRNVLLNNLLIYMVVNAFFMSILEAWIYLDEGLKEKERAENLRRELKLEADNRALYEHRAIMEAEKNKLAREMIMREKRLNQTLENEIRERELIADELNKSREQLNSILQNLPGAAYRCAFDSRFSMDYISAKIEDISGYPSSDFRGDNRRAYASIIFQEDYGFVFQQIKKAVAEKCTFEIEYRIQQKNGTLIWVKETGKAVYSEEGKPLYLDGIIMDISARKEAERMASENERKYKDLMDLLPQPVFELDTEGNVLFSNKAGDEFFGPLPQEPGQKQQALNCFLEIDRERIIESFRQSALGLQTEPGEFTAIKKDGSLCPVMVFGNPIIRNGTVVGRRGIIIDISERKKQELKLLQAKEELERINNTLEQNIADRTKQLTEANTQLLKMQKENLQSQFEVLKQQVNPHFLFNSLNVLTSLIKVEPDLAESFTEQLSKVYRYVLENKEKDLVSLGTELEFLNAYLFLLGIRFMSKLSVTITIDKKFHDYLILPIAIQLIIENAIKHNTFSKAAPLRIEIFVDSDLHLNIVNNLKQRETKIASTGVGLQNITRRYALVSELIPSFSKTAGHFMAKLPLIKPEKTESE